LGKETADRAVVAVMSVPSNGNAMRLVIGSISLAVVAVSASFYLGMWAVNAMPDERVQAVAKQRNAAKKGRKAPD
jgi:hypothetical protein